jgi:hypothetical protein
MMSRIASTHAAKLFATAAVIDVDRLVWHLMCTARTVVIALWTYAAWLFLSYQPLHRFR